MQRTPFCECCTGSHWQTHWICLNLNFFCQPESWCQSLTWSLVTWGAALGTWCTFFKMALSFTDRPTQSLSICIFGVSQNFTIRHSPNDQSTNVWFKVHLRGGIWHHGALWWMFDWFLLITLLNLKILVSAWILVLDTFLITDLQVYVLGHLRGGIRKLGHFCEWFTELC